MSDLETGAHFGPYVVEGFIAGGGMGRVYAAKHEVYQQPAALKVLHDRFTADPRWHRRFSEEGLIGMGLKHPCVLSARELLEQDGQLALVMDLVRGGWTLLSAIEREHPSGLTLTDGLGVFLKVLSGVEYLHERGIVHGDLKPENVLLEGPVREPGSWRPMVTDFGTVSLIADPVVIDGVSAVVASPRYASPEHLQGSDQLEVRSDVHALGLLLHWLLTGEHLSGARTVAEARETLSRPWALVRLVDQPEPLQAVLRTAIATDPADRYPDCRALALAIRDVLDELGVGLDVEDLQSELATEILEERAAAQKALQRGDGPPPSEDDTELELQTYAPEGQDPDATSEGTAEPLPGGDGEASGDGAEASGDGEASGESAEASGEGAEASGDGEASGEGAEASGDGEASGESAEASGEKPVPLSTLLLGTLGIGAILGLLSALLAWLLGFVG